MKLEKVLAVVATISIVVIVIFVQYNPFSNQSTFVSEEYGYKISRPNQDWSFVTNFEKVPVLKSNQPQFAPELAIDGLLVENLDDKLTVLVFTDTEPEKDLTSIVEKEKDWAIEKLDGDFIFPESPVGNSVYLEWKESQNTDFSGSESADGTINFEWQDNSDAILTRELVMKKNGFVYFVYYEIHSSKLNSDLDKEIQSIFNSFTI